MRGAKSKEHFMLIKAATSIGAGVRHTLASDDDLVVGKGVSVVSTDETAVYVQNIQDQADRISIRVDGLVQARDVDSAIDAGATEQDDVTRIVIGTTGMVLSGGYALYLGGSSSDGAVVNHGRIIGRDGIWLGAGDTYDITNTGTIIASRYGIIGNQAEMAITFHNSGRLVGNVLAFEGASSRDRVFNAGVITGEVNLLNGNDLYDGRGGKVIGTVTGGPGADRIIPGQARDVFDGGTEFDTLDFRKLGAVRLALDGSFANGGAARGDSYVYFEKVLGSDRGNDVLRGDEGTNILFGNGGDDSLNGGDGADVLSGGSGNDRIVGGVDLDTISGGAGRDRITGGVDEDSFVYQRASDGGDVITDFNGGGLPQEAGKDQFLISARGFGLKEQARGAFNEGWFHAGRTNQAQDGNDHFIFRTTDTTLWFDPDGAGGRGPILLADLQAGAMLVAANFDLI
jgi:Ca2+-binding RTX toxin-like protein